MIEEQLIVCGTLVLLAVIAAWLVARVTQKALERAEPKDIPKAVAGLANLLGGFRAFVPNDRNMADAGDVGTVMEPE